MLARCALDVFDDIFAKAFRCLCHLLLLGDYDEPETLSYQFDLFGPTSADVRQSGLKIHHPATR